MFKIIKSKIYKMEAEIRKKSWINFPILILIFFILKLNFWPSILISSPLTETTTQKSPLETFIDNLDQVLTQLGNKKLAVLPFESLEGPSLTKEAAIASEKLLQALINSGRFEIVDKSLLGIKSTNEITPELASKWTNTFGLGTIIVGTVLRASENVTEINIRVINLKTFSVSMATQLEMRTVPPKESSIPSALAQLKQKIALINSQTLDPKTKEELIMKTIAETFKATPTTKYAYAYFPCGLAPEVCKNLNLQDGFYKIFFDDELILTVDLKGNILESYYYGKNHPQRIDIKPEEYLQNKSN